MILLLVFDTQCLWTERERHAERGKGKSSCLQNKTLEWFVEEGRLNLQLCHGWQGLTITPSPTAQCCLGADNRQNKANVEPFLIAHRAQHDQTAQRAGNKAASFGACFLLLLFFKSPLSAKQTFDWGKQSVEHAGIRIHKQAFGNILEERKISQTLTLRPHTH